MTYPYKMFKKPSSHTGAQKKGYAMIKYSVEMHESPEEIDETLETLDKVVYKGAVKMLKEALAIEVANYLKRNETDRDERGYALVTRNGYGKKRRVTTGAGELKIKAPRVNDRRLDEDGNRRRFRSSLLPPFLRRTKNMEELFPVLYLKGISTGDFEEALEALLGKGVIGLSASNITRLKRVWEDEYDKWRKQDLSNKHYVYIWVDGIYFNVRLDSDRQCILVMMGATSDGKKELIAIQDGYRESKESWQGLIRALKARGLAIPPSLAVGDGALGFWAALREEWSDTKEQRCWVHKMSNVLDKMPKSVQGRAKSLMHDIYQAETKKKADKAFDLFINTFDIKYKSAVDCLKKDRDVLLTFYDYPAQHWMHLRSTNPIESTFATVRLRTKKTKGCGSRIATLTMVFKLVQSAQKRWKRLRSRNLIIKVVEGVKFEDGIMSEEDAA